MDTVLAAPAASGDFAADSAAFSAYWRGQTDRQAGRDARWAFLRRHARTLYDRLTDSRRKFVRIERLVYDAAAAVPGLAPTKAQVDAESELKQSEKQGVEIDQGILANQFLADPECGRHLCHAMLLPREESSDALAKFRRDGHLDLGTARVERHGKAAVLLLETAKPPPEAVVEKVAKATGLEPGKLTFLFAPTQSLAGTAQIVARVLEVALHKANDLKFPLENIVDGIGAAPLPSPHPDFLTAMGRTNDAIIYGGSVQLFVRGSAKAAEELARQLPSQAVLAHAAVEGDAALVEQQCVALLQAAGGQRQTHVAVQ